MSMFDIGAMCHERTGVNEFRDAQARLASLGNDDEGRGRRIRKDGDFLKGSQAVS